VTPAARRHRLARRHHLHPDHRAPDIATATHDMVVLHSTDPASVFLGLLARTEHVTVPEIETALYDDRSLVRILAMRRTLFVARAEDAAIPFVACSLSVAERQRKAMATQLARGSDVEDPESFIADAMAVAAAAIGDAGETSARALTEAHPILQTRWNPAPDSKWGASSPVTSRVLSQLDMEGMIERCRPAGVDFTSTAHRWRLADSAVRERALGLDPDDARATLLGWWLRRFGPATEDDLVWWTGLTKTLVRRAVGRLDVEPVDLEGKPGMRLVDDPPGGPDDVDPGPWVALLPGLDPTAMGWRDRSWYVGPHTEALFDRAGNVGPTIWVDGRIVGGWAQRADGSIVTRLLETVDDDHRDLLELEATRTAEFLGDVRVTPRFRTPLERDLRA
jgi:hypothetical protein